MQNKISENSKKYLHNILNDYSKIGRNENNGIDRVALTKGDKEGRDYFIKLLKENNFDVKIPNYINSNVKFLIIKNIGVLISKNSKVEINEILLFMSKILLKLNNSNNLNYLSKKNINDLINWDAEKYRLQLSR